MQKLADSVEAPAVLDFLLVEQAAALSFSQELLYCCRLVQ